MSTTVNLPTAEDPPSPFLHDPTSPPAASHKRTYQACIPCRQRKVRCDLGPVDAPHDPPCVRCRREKKNCYFTPTRRKRKADAEDEQGASSRINDERPIYNHRSTTGTESHDDGVFPHTQDTPPSVSQSSIPALRGYGTSHEGLLTYSRPPYVSPQNRDPNAFDSQEVTNETATALFREPINNPKDALHVLIEAAGRTEDMIRQDDKAGLTSPSQKGEVLVNSQVPQPQLAHQSDRLRAIDPAIANIVEGNITSQGGGLTEALRAWSRLRFIRAGWFTAKEAISYIDYFYKHLAPLTPISTPDFRPLFTHPRLLSEEPMLAVTFLTIAARYKRLESPGGQSRSFLIHEKLWNHLQGMITRMFWGQEQFGGGFCGAGAVRLAPRLEKTNTGKLRSLGTIESLLLLTDWHPRSMHFPPGDDDDEIIAPLESELNDVPSNHPATSANFGGWTEPALRSDRMCWSLIGCAYALSYELGVFEDLKKNGSTFMEKTAEARLSGHQPRADRIGRLLYIYMTQTSGRLCYPNMLPDHEILAHSNYLKFLPRDTQLDESAHDVVLESIQRSWAEVTTLMKQGNADIFPSKERTHEIIQSKLYLSILRKYQPKLRAWLSSFQEIELPQRARTILMIEYEYMRTYINSLSLQAVLESCTSTAYANAASDTGAHPNQGTHTASALLPSELVDLYKDNETYIAEVVDASRNILRHVVNGLLPDGCLKHAPVRTHFRILSGAMFLLKTFALGAKEEEVAISMQLLDNTVEALRISVVDDVHLCLRIADLLEGLTSNIRTKFVRLAVHGRESRRPSSREKHSRLHPQIVSRTAQSGKTEDNLQTTSQNSYEDTYGGLQGPLAGISKSPIDPNDSSITIMPPPDYFYSNPYTFNSPNCTQQFTPQLSPNHSNHTNNSYQKQYQQQTSPQDVSLQNQDYHQTNNYVPSNSYHWLTLDVNPLLNTNDNQFAGSAGTNSWSTPFGPDLGNSLEMLDMLANDPFAGGDMAF